MAIRTLLQRWIEVLAGVYFACCEAWGVRRAVIIACEGDHFTLRKVTPKANTDPLSMQIDATDQDEVSALVPGKAIPGRIRRAVEDSQIIFELPSAEVVVRRISVPAQARDFLLGIVRNRIDRLSPWPADQTAYGVDAAPNSEDPANLDVRVLITSRSTIDVVRDRLVPMGLAIDRVVARQSPTETTLITLWSRLAALPQEDLDRARWRIGAGIAAAIAFSAALSLSALVSAASWRAASDDTAARSKALQRQIEGTSAQSLASLKPSERLWREKETSPTGAIVIEAVSRALSDTAYLTEMHVDGVTLRMVGVTSDAASLIAPLEQSGHVTDVHFFAPTTREADGSRFRFHLEARIKPHATIAEKP
jgi:general secretion pathway protein L